MPDLSRRPARYATAAVLCGALVVSAALTSEVEWGRDSPTVTAAKVGATLREGASDVVTVASPGLGAAIAPRESDQAAPAGPGAVASGPGRVGPGGTGIGAAASSRSAGAKSEAAKSRSTKASAAAAGKKTSSAASTVFLGGAGVRAATGTAAGAALLGRPAATAAPYSGSEVLLAALRAPRPTVVQVAAPATAARPAPAVAAPPAPAPRPADPAPKPAAPQPKPVPEPAPKPTPPAGPKKDPATPVAPTPPNCGMFPYQEAAQAAYDADPVKNKALDGDGDGVACEQLRPKVAPPVLAPPRTEPQAPPQQPAPPAGPKRPKAPSRAEIVASGTYFGLATGTREESASLEYALGRQTSAESFFKGWDTGYDADRVTAAWRDGRLPVMTWESRPLAYAEDPDAPDVDYSLEAIAAGTFDEYLTGYARQVTALGLPVVIRFDHEMNGDWYRWSELGRKGGPARSADGAYAAAWKHVHDVFQGEGANNSVIWLWAPNRVDNLSAARFKPINAYYPGGDYVDWVGMSGYFRTEDVDRKQPNTFDATFAKTLGQLRDVAAGKPIFLAEVGATATDPARRDDSSKVSWTQSFFDGLARQDDVAGFSWFNYAVSEDGRTNDWRLDSSQRVFDAVAQGLVESGFGFEPGKDFRTRPLGTRPVPGPLPEPTPEPTPEPSPEPTPGPTPTGPVPTPEPTPTGPAPEPAGPTPGPSAPPTTTPATGPAPEPDASVGVAPEGNRS